MLAKIKSPCKGKSFLFHSFYPYRAALLLSSVEHRSKGTFAIEELLCLLLDTKLSYHFKIIIAALYAEPSVLHTDEGNAGNQ